jgi:hypothetical protein
VALAMSLAMVAAAAAEKDLAEPTGHKYVSNVEESAIDDLVAQGYRLFDIEVVGTGPNRYAGSMVKNAGPYETGWWWTANKTKADLVAYYEQRGARITDLESYTVDGVRRYAATMVENRGRDEKDWWWFDRATWDEMNEFASEHDARITDLDVEVVNGKRYFSGVMLRNFGADHKDWVVFSNISKAQVKQEMADRRMRLVDLERISEDKFAGVLEEKNGEAWWWFTNQDWDGVQWVVGQYGSRVIDIERRVKGNKASFDLLLINNANDLEWRIGEMLRDGSDGTRGFILKQVGGSTRGDLMASFQTYPASSIKVLEHFYWSRQVGLGLSAATNVPLYTNHTSDTHTQNQIQKWQTLQATAQLMMRPSSNQDANALQDFAGGGNGATGRTNINTFAANIGLSDEIKLNHKFASGGANNNPANAMTMRQIAALYEKSADGSVLNNAGLAYFRNNMLNQTGAGGNALGAGILSVCQQEGGAIGMTNAEINAFYNQLLFCWKPGNWPSQSQYVSSAGWIQIPYNTPDGTVTREFVFGAFVDDFTTNTLGSLSQNVLPEILRGELYNALLTWN